MKRGFLKFTSMAATLVSAAMIAVVMVAVGCSSSHYAAAPAPAGPVLPAAGELSRAQFVAQVSDHFGWSHQSNYNDFWKVPVRTFSDVSATDLYGKQIECAYEENIIAPDASGKFNPSTVMTRQDAAVIFAKAFFIPLPGDNSALNAFSDASTIAEAAKPSVAALVAAGYMPGRTGTTFAPTSTITAAEAQAVFDNIAANSVEVVQAMPKQAATYLTVLPEGAGSTVAAPAVDAAVVTQLLTDRNYAPRRFIQLTTTTPGATIFYTTDLSDPTTSATRQVYDINVTGRPQELVGDRSGAKGPQPYRMVTWKTVAVKDGLAISPVRTFHWNLYRPWTSVYNADVILPGNFDPSKGTITPKVTRMCSDYESVRAMSWLIEGPGSAVVMDALQTPWNTADQTAGTLYDKARSLVPSNKSISLVVGHAHGDHNAQTQNFITGGATVYANSRSWAAIAGVLSSPDQIKLVNNIDEGDQVKIGTAAVPLTFDVYAPPGHENSLVMLHDKVSGYLFTTDFYGCTRCGTADNVSLSGARMDMLHSIMQQTAYKYRSNNGKVTLVFTGHDESGLPQSREVMLRQVFQNIVDEGEAACQPTNRGSDAPRTRIVNIGNMYTDLYNWAAVGIGGGVFGNYPYSYLSGGNAATIAASGVANYFSSGATRDYTVTGGYLKYGVLGNIELTGATLVGTDVTWANPNTQVTLTDGSKWPVAGPVPNSRPNMFNPWVFAYTINVPTGRTSIGIAPIPLSSKVKKITVNGNVILPETSVTVTVANGTVITIVVTAPDGTTTETYTLTVAYV